MSIFEFTTDRLIELKATTFAAHGLKERGDLQRLLRDQIEVIDPDVLIVSEEFRDWEDSNRRIDLLGIDSDANLVVIELKRTEDGGHMELQALRYAAMVSKMTFDKVVEVFEDYLANLGRHDSARERLLNFLQWDTPNEDQFAQEVRIVLASAEFSKELTSAVLWLNEYELDIRCVRLRPFRDGNRIFLDVQQVIPLPEASEYFVNLRQKREVERQARRQDRQWTGLWFVNLGMDSADDLPVDTAGHGYIRHWQHCVKYGYIAAGGGRRYSDALKKLKLGDPILAYQRSRGYVGYGIVTKQATPIQDFQLPNGASLESTINPSELNEARTEDKWEYASGVDWRAHFDLSNAKTFKGIFANQNVVCKLSHPQTIRFVGEQFNIPADADNPL
jgi:hypothetical protein